MPLSTFPTAGAMINRQTSRIPIGFADVMK